MEMKWDSFSEAIGEDGLVHLVRQGETNSLCGNRTKSGATEGGRACSKCRNLRQEMLGELPGDGA
jgi:hypothetical protein